MLSQIKSDVKERGATQPPRGTIAPMAGLDQLPRDAQSILDLAVMRNAQ